MTFLWNCKRLIIEVKYNFTYNTISNMPKASKTITLYKYLCFNNKHYKAYRIPHRVILMCR